eukprot:TRINITY_DN51903_c0_g1_i1.p1 TRINITY_DN51903_c0_g1~~TRINITY_DN51903_c0_g1_i1.p1  ORF type:complete len:654 (-),score=285.79 TRINITY_DN51903_c0_g1_i1:45-1943(-)
MPGFGSSDLAKLESSSGSTGSSDSQNGDEQAAAVMCVPDDMSLGAELVKYCLTDGVGADVLLRVGPKRELVKAHRLVLCARSELLRERVRKAVVEQQRERVDDKRVESDNALVDASAANNQAHDENEGDLPVIDMVDVASAVLQEALHFMYSDRFTRRVTPNFVTELQQFANKYQVTALLRVCNEFLARGMTVDNCLQFIDIAPDQCLEFALKNAQRVFKRQREEFVKLPRRAIQALCESTEVGMASEVELFKAVYAWAENQVYSDKINQYALLDDESKAIRRVFVDGVVLRASSTVADHHGDVDFDDEKKKKKKDNNDNSGNNDDQNAKDVVNLLNLIRFPTMTMEEFAQNVVPTNVLTAEEQVAVFTYIAAHDPKADATKTKGGKAPFDLPFSTVPRGCTAAPFSMSNAGVTLRQFDVTMSHPQLNVQRHAQGGQIIRSTNNQYRTAVIGIAQPLALSSMAPANNKDHALSVCAFEFQITSRGAGHFMTLGLAPATRVHHVRNMLTNMGFSTIESIGWSLHTGQVRQDGLGVRLTLPQLQWGNTDRVAMVCVRKRLAPTAKQWSINVFVFRNGTLAGKIHTQHLAFQSGTALRPLVTLYGRSAVVLSNRLSFDPLPQLRGYYPNLNKDKL